MAELKGIRVLVTGGTGFIGANLVRELLRREAEVHVLVRPAGNLWRIAELVPKLTLHRVNLIEAARLCETVSAIHPEVIYHLAASSGHHDNPAARREALQSGVLGTANLLEAVQPINFRRFVHMGSSLEYGPKTAPLRETDALLPITFRGVTKAAATLLSQQFARAHGRPLIVLRPFSVYGYWESSSRLIPTAIMAVLRNCEMALTSAGVRHDFIFIEDVIEACLLALEAKDADGEIINVGSGEQWSNEQVVEMVQTFCGQRIQVKMGAFPLRPVDTAYWLADIQKAKRLLGWQPRHTLPRGLEKTIAWFRSHSDAYDTC